jgi:uroporphyrinogen-III decarboxylase
MSGGVPDCLPVIPQICLPHAALMLGLDFEETLLAAIRDPSLMAKYTLECAKAYGVDGVRIWMPGDPLDVVEVDGKWHGKNPQTGEVLGEVDFMGGGGVVPSEKPSIHTEADIERIPIPSVEEIIKSGKLDAIKSAIDDAGDDFFVITMPGAFTVEYLTTVRGKAQAMVDLMDRPEFCHMALEKALQISIQKALALTEIGIDGFLLGETFGGVVGPALYRQFCLPYFQRFVEAIKGRGPLIYLHTCGNSRQILELMAETGADCIEPLDPLGGVEVWDAKKRVGDRVALMGGLNTVKLAQGTLQEVKDDCARCLNEGAVGGGYLLACGDMLPTETSREKVEYIIEAAHSYRYD